jgi:hypothetical protein
MSDSFNELEMDEVHRSIELARENILDAALILFQDNVPGFDFTYPMENGLKSYLKAQLLSLQQLMELMLEEINEYEF